jgi:hypothetical protein
VRDAVKKKLSEASTAGSGPPEEPKEEIGLEMRLGSYWMPRIGAAIAVIGVVFFLSYIGRGSPEVRVAIGYAVCAAFLATAWRLEKRYPPYARVLYAVGFATSYFVTFATHYVPFARVIDNPLITIGLLAMVVGAWAVAAQMRQSRIIAFLVTFLGHLTIFLHLHEDPQSMGATGLASLALLSAGSAFFLLKNRWYAVAFVGVLGTGLNHAAWLVQTSYPLSEASFIGGLGSMSFCFIVFALADLCAPTEVRRIHVPAALRNVLVSANSAGLFFLGLWVVQAYPPAQSHTDLFCFVCAAVLLLVALAYQRWRKHDPLYNAYFIKAVAAFTLGLALRYDSDTLTASLAIQTVVLLESSRRSGLVITRFLAFGVALLALLHGIFIVLVGAVPGFGDPGFSGALVKLGLTLIAFYGASYFYQRIDWRSRSVNLSDAPVGLQRFMWYLDAAESPPTNDRGDHRMLDGLLFPYLYAGAGTLLATLFVLALFTGGAVFLALAAAALILTALGTTVTSRPWCLGALVLAAVSACTAAYVLIAECLVAVEPVALFWVVLGLTALAATAAFSEQRFFKARPALVFHQHPTGSYGLYLSTAFIVGLLVAVRADAYTAIIGLCAAAVVSALLMLWLHAGAFTIAATGLCLWGQVLWLLANSEGDPVPWRLVGTVAVALPLGLDRYLRYLRESASSRVCGRLLTFASWLLAMHYVGNEAFADWKPTWWCLVSTAYLIYGGAFRARAAVIASIGGAAFASAIHLGNAYTSTALSTTPLATGFVLLAAYWMLIERLSQKWGQRNDRYKNRIQWITALMVGTAVLLLVALLERLPIVGDEYLTLAWAFLAVGLFGIFLGLRQKYYRYAGLVVFVLALGRAGMDAWKLEGIYKAGAYAGLGVLLLVVGFGYQKALERSRASHESDPPAPTE